MSSDSVMTASVSEAGCNTGCPDVDATDGHGSSRKSINNHAEHHADVHKRSCSTINEPRWQSPELIPIERKQKALLQRQLRSLRPDPYQGPVGVTLSGLSPTCNRRQRSTRRRLMPPPCPLLSAPPAQHAPPPRSC